ncbi:MAG: hypothetical protein KBD19_01245 [Candidatus Moranbacteria bacterium]|nr:hypothetical protein [Candidatus Moranbacteria bacterium]
MSDARILSLDEFRKRKTSGPSIHQEFDVLFRNARELRGVGQDLAPEEIAIMTWSGMQSWFRREIADEVFRRHMFGRCVLLSISFVSDLLTSFANDCGDRTGIVEHLDEYAGEGNPEDILDAANTAFLMFAFWPEKQTRRSVRYRQLALAFGPSLYAMHAGRARRDFGYCMAEAFEPLGNIARERFGHG